MNIDIFSNHFFFGVNRLFILIYSNEDDNSKRFKAKRLFTKRYNQQL